MKMNRDAARDHARSQLKSYLESRGMKTGRGKVFRCLNPNHNDEHPSMSFDAKRNKAHCFSCDADMDIFDCIKALEPGCGDDKAAFQFAYDFCGIDLEDSPPRQAKSGKRQAKRDAGAPSPEESKRAEEGLENKQLIEKASKAPNAAEYFERRGISKRIVEAFKLGRIVDFSALRVVESADGQTHNQRETWDAALIPTGEGSYVARNTDERADKRNRYRKSRGPVRIFNAEALRAERPVFIVEGEIDALSLAEIGKSAVALGSASNVDKLVEMCRSMFKDTKPRYPFILYMDDDEQGRAAAEKLLKGFEGAGISAFVDDYLYGKDFKDANEWLVCERDSFTASVEIIEARARQYREREHEKLVEKHMKNSAAGYIEAFKGDISDSVNTPSTSTGFSSLDSKLDSGLYEGLYIIGSISSLGKTTFALQIADQIARQKRDVLVFSLEMSRFELMAKSISRLTYTLAQEKGLDNRNAKTLRGITDGKRYAGYSREERQLIADAINKYAEYARYIYITEGMGDVGIEQIRKTIDDHKKATENTPVIIVDYLQLIAPPEPRATDKQNTDKIVLEMKRISRDYKTPALCVSSFNRENYNSPVSMSAFKESGAIEYSSDVLIGLQLKGVEAAQKQGNKNKGGFSVDEAKKKNPREVELKILKNRNGPTGLLQEYKYYQMFNFFHECPPGY